MKNRRTYVLTAGLLTAFFACLFSWTLAEGPAVNFIWTVEGQKVSVSLFEKKGDFFLFVPGACRGQDPVIQINRNLDLVWDGETYANGSTLPLSGLQGREVRASLSSGKKIGQVRVMWGSRIPSLFFTMSGADLKRAQSSTKLDIQGDAELVMLTGDGKIDDNGKVTSFHARGNSTFFATKKAFEFSLDHKADLAGMEKAKKWILLANYFDISLIRNQITFDLCREIGLEGTPDCRQADVYLNGKYNGTYLLTEKIQLKSGRLEIEDLEETLEELNGREAYDSARRKLDRSTGKTLRYFDLKKEPEDVSGGYLLEIEKELHYRIDEESAGFATDGTMCIVVKEPTHAGKRCLQYISVIVNDFHNAVLNPEGICPRTGSYYTSYIDPESFAGKVIIEEFSTNYDVRAGSQFMYKDADSADPRLKAGPGWDYDLTYGNKDDGVRNPLKEDYVSWRSAATSMLYHWLLTHEDFRKLTRKRFEEVFMPAAEVLTGEREPAEGSSLKSVEAYLAEIADSAEMNFSRWSARSVPDITNESGRTFQDAGVFLQNWIKARLEMLKRSWLKEEEEK